MESLCDDALRFLCLWARIGVVEFERSRVEWLPLRKDQFMGAMGAQGLPPFSSFPPVLFASWLTCS